MDVDGPASTAPALLTEWVASCAKLSSPGFKGGRWSSSWSLLAAHGVSFSASSPLPPSFSRGPMGECYHNSWAAASRDPQLVYCEGVALSEDLPVPLSHAWCLHTPSGEVVDLTWDSSVGVHYLGLAFPRDLVAEALVRSSELGVVSVLDGDWARRGWFHEQANAARAVEYTKQVTANKSVSKGSPAASSSRKHSSRSAGL